MENYVVDKISTMQAVDAYIRKFIQIEGYLIGYQCGLRRRTHELKSKFPYMTEDELNMYSELVNKDNEITNKLANLLSVEDRFISIFNIGINELQNENME